MFLHVPFPVSLSFDFDHDELSFEPLELLSVFLKKITTLIYCPV